MRIAIAQMDLAWRDEAANLRKVEQLAGRAQEADLLVLPEMFTTGFCMDAAELATTMEGAVIQQLKEISKRYNLALYGSLMVKENARYYNRGVFITPDGALHTYDKHHLFSPGTEAETYSAGKEKVIVSYKGWNICLQICYDLRFPVFVRNVGNEYDLILYVANWAESRISSWSRLLPARAIENMAYVCGVNRVGEDPYGAQGGESVLLDPLGNSLLSCGKEETLLISEELTKERLEKMRLKFPVHKDADHFTIQ